MVSKVTFPRSPSHYRARNTFEKAVCTGRTAIVERDLVVNEINEMRSHAERRRQLDRQPRDARHLQRGSVLHSVDLRRMLEERNKKDARKATRGKKKRSSNNEQLPEEQQLQNNAPPAPGPQAAYESILNFDLE